MKMEQVKLMWYVRNISLKVLLGWLVGMVVLWMEITFYK